MGHADRQDHVAAAALELGVDGREARIHGIARCIREQEDPSRAELALAVADDVQGLGIGRLLIEQLGCGAHTQRIERFLAPRAGELPAVGGTIRSGDSGMLPNPVAASNDLEAVFNSPADCEEGLRG